MNNNSIIFEGKTFCFTGEMVDIKRSDAEKEVRKRGSYPVKATTRQLDYLVIGSVPNPAWKFGKYGNKINEATKLRNEMGRPHLISESDFIDALVNTEPKYSGLINEKMVFIRFNFYCKDNKELLDHFDSIVHRLKEQHRLHTTKSIYDLSGLVFLFDLKEGITSEDVLKVEYRLFKHLNATDTTTHIINDVMNALTSIDEIDGNFSFSEPLEGASIFMKLLDELPVNLKLQRQ